MPVLTCPVQMVDILLLKAVNLFMCEDVFLCSQQPSLYCHPLLSLTEEKHNDYDIQSVTETVALPCTITCKRRFFVYCERCITLLHFAVTCFSWS